MSDLGGKKYRWYHECEANCTAMAKDLIPFEGEAFQFCNHHADKIAEQLVAKKAQEYETVGPTLSEIRRTRD